MKTYNLLLTSLFLLFSNCQKEEATSNKFKIINNSGSAIKIIPASSSIDSLVLLNNETKEVDLPFTRGIGTGINYAIFADGNPIIVVYNNTDSIIHYNDTLSHPSKSYNLYSERCFIIRPAITKKL